MRKRIHSGEGAEDAQYRRMHGAGVKMDTGCMNCHRSSLVSLNFGIFLCYFLLICLNYSIICSTLIGRLVESILQILYFKEECSILPTSGDMDKNVKKFVNLDQILNLAQTLTPLDRNEIYLLVISKSIQCKI